MKNFLHLSLVAMIAASSPFQTVEAAAVDQPPVQTVLLKGDAGGKRFDGIGVVDGGGATSVLLKDYPEPQRSQILDLLYKPKFGASVSALLVEIPGDGNSTQGAMPSHMHTRDDLNYWRGYTWWVMRQAKARNPRLTLDGAAWSAPGWIGDTGPLFSDGRGGDKQFFSQDAADYYVKWLIGLRDVHGMEMDALGMRNEKGVSYGLIKALRRTLDGTGFGNVKLHAFDNWPDQWKFDFVKDLPHDAELRAAIDIIGAHINAPKSVVPAQVQQIASRLGKPIWNTEGHVYIAGYDGLISIVEAFNENFIRSGVTKIINWYGIAGVYTMQPYPGVKEAAVRANWPWSGHFKINPSLWGYAHYGQFSEAGWTYLAGGSGGLAAGGTYVTLKAPGDDYSVIIETKDASAPQTLRLHIGGGLSGDSLAVWRSNEKEHFMRLADAQPVEGTITLTLDPQAVYSVTTTRGQHKATFDQVPEQQAFPFPYRETFDQYSDPRSWGYLPRYLADISGTFELSNCPARRGTCLRQVIPKPSISWAPDWKPYTLLGDDQWSDYEVNADVLLAPGESAAVMGRVNHAGTGYSVIPKGYFLRLDEQGEVSLVVVRGKVDKKALIGDAEQQAIIKAQNETGKGGEKILAVAKAKGVRANRWHKLTLRFRGTQISGLVDGRKVIEATDAQYGKGMAGLMADSAATGLSMPYFDNLSVHRGKAPLPLANVPHPGQQPIYPPAATRRSVGAR